MSSKWLILDVQVMAKLFDMLSDHSNVDHPLCEECTDQLLLSLERQLEQAEQDSQQYQVRQLFRNSTLTKNRDILLINNSDLGFCSSFCGEQFPNLHVLGPSIHIRICGWLCIEI